MKSLRLLTVFRVTYLRLFLALTACTAFGSRAAYGYAMAIDMRPGGWGTGAHQGAWGWFFGFKENSKETKGVFHLMTCEKPTRDARWVSGAGDGAAILCHREASPKPGLWNATTFVWHEGRIPVCRWISPQDGEIFIDYSLVATGDLPKGVPVRLTVSGKDVEMSDRSAPAKQPKGPAFHREVLRMSRWFGVKVRKGSVLDFSLDFPGRDLISPDATPVILPPKHVEITVCIGLQPVEFSAFSDGYRATEEARREREILKDAKREGNGRTGKPPQPEPQETEEQLAKEAQADAAPLRLLAHKTYQCLSSYPADFSMQEGVGDWSYGSDDGSGFQPMRPQGAKWVGAEGVAISADKLTAASGIVPVIRWKCPVTGRMDMRCVFSNESISYGSIKIHRAKENPAPLPPDAVGFSEVGGSGREQTGVNDTGKGDLCEFRFALPKAKPTPPGNVSGKEKAQEQKELPEKFETGAFIQIIQQLEQDPSLPPSGPIMCL